MWEPGWYLSRGAQLPVVWPSLLCLPLKNSGLSAVAAFVVAKVLLIEQYLFSWAGDV